MSSEQPIPERIESPQVAASIRAHLNADETKSSDATGADINIAAHTTTDESTAPSIKSSPAPVELPPKIEELDRELEAELQAAMVDDEQLTTDDLQMDQHGQAERTNQQPIEESLEPGTRLKGRVQSVHGDNVFVDLGYRSPGVFKLRQYESPKPPVVGQEFEVIVDQVESAEGLIVVNPPGGAQHLKNNWDAVSTGQIVDCLVTKTNKGGLEVTFGTLRGFLPAGQVDFRYVDDLKPFVGQKIRVKIIEANRQKRNLVVSRRDYLEIEREKQEQELWSAIELGQTFTGTVKTIKDYGAFIDVGGTDGFLHIGEISWTRINHPSDVLQVGQSVEVKILSLDPEKKRIGLGMKQLAQSPWATVAEKYSSGQTVNGKVTRTTNFGAFIELESGIEGLVHISELDYKRVNKVTDVLNVDQEVDVQVIDVNSDQHRIRLSLKSLKSQDEPTKSSDQHEPNTPNEIPPTESKAKAPLKGGIGEATKDALFGNPIDYT